MNDKGAKRGRFIVIEGIDGSGKSTQIQLLANRLMANKRKVYTTAEPTVSLTGGMLRDALRGVTKKTTCEIASMFLLDRIFHNVNPVNGIEKFLSAGVDVICDRYYYSSLAYQGSETDFDWVLDMNLNCPEIRRPDLCIFLDISPKKAIERIGARGEAKEIYEKEETLALFRNTFLRVFDTLDDRVAVIDADGTPDEVFSRILTAVEPLLD